MWIELVKTHCSDSEFRSPANEIRMQEADIQLGLSLHRDLKDLLGETNGVIGEYGLDLVWGIDRIVSDNLTFRDNEDFRTLYMPFDHLLFFGDTGNGDMFAYSICGGVIRRPDVYVWNHEDDSRSWVAPSLIKYLEWWLTGIITL